MQKANGERGTRAHAATRRKIAIMMDFYSAIDLEEAQNFTHRRVRNFVDGVAILHLGVNNTISVLKEGRQITAGDIAVLVDRGGQYSAAVLTIPSGIVCAASEERDSKWRPAHNHNAILPGRSRFTLAHLSPMVTLQTPSLLTGQE